MTSYHLLNRLAGVILLSAASLSFSTQAQNTTSMQPFQPPAPATNGSAGSFSTNSNDPEQVHMLHKMVKERNAIRQQTIVDDTDRLLDLAKQLKDAVDKSSKDQLSLEVVNTASEIEKLAKTVKEKMRDGE